MSAPDDPYASPPRDREAPAERPPAPPAGAWPPAGGWGAPSGPPATGPGPGGRPPRQAGPPSSPGAGGIGTAALVVGVLSLVLGVSIVGGVVLGGLAIGLGMRGRAMARAGGGRSGTAVAGIVLGVLGFLAAGATYLYVRAPLTDYRACLRGSVSFADDRACKEQLRHRVVRN